MMHKWLRRHLIRRSRARRQPRERVIVSTRPYDWELDGFGDDLYATSMTPELDVPRRAPVTDYADANYLTLVHWDESMRNETGNDHDA